MVARERLTTARRGLLVQLAGMGDLIMAVPAIRCLQHALPQIRWTLVTRNGHGDLVSDWIEDIASIAWPPTPATMLATLRTLYRLRRQRFDVAMHLYRIRSRVGAAGIQAVFCALRPGLSIGRVTAVSGDLFDLNWREETSGLLHEVDLNLGMVRGLGLDCPVIVPSLTPDPATRARLAASLATRVPPGTPTVALFPGGARPTRHWPASNYEVLAGLLAERGVAICVVGDGTDRPAARRIMRAAGKLGCDVTGGLSMRELAAFLSLMTAYVGNDSGPTHIATAVGTPCVALFGPGDHAWIGPRGTGEIRLLRYPVDCAPCYLQTCAHHTCMRSLTLGEVLASVCELLETPPSANLVGQPAGGSHALH